MPNVSAARLVTPSFARLWLATFGAFATFGMVVLALPLYVKDELGYGSLGIGVAMGAASMTSIVFSAISGRFGDRHGRRPLLVCGGIVMFVCYLALALQPELGGVVAIRLVAGAALLIVSGIGRSEAVGYALAAQTLLILAGAAALCLSVMWATSRRLAGAAALRLR